MLRILAVLLLLAMLAVFFEGESLPYPITRSSSQRWACFRGRRRLLLQRVRAAGDRLRLAQVVQGLLLPDRPRPLGATRMQEGRREGSESAGMWRKAGGEHNPAGEAI